MTDQVGLSGDSIAYDWRVVVVRHKMDGDTRKVIKCESEDHAEAVVDEQAIAGHPLPVIERRPKVHQAQWEALDV